MRGLPRRSVAPSPAAFVEGLERRLLFAAGAVDPAFGVGGLVSGDLAAMGDGTAGAAVLQTDGKRGGRETVGSTAGIAVLRYNADGSLDGSFGAGGAFVSTLGYGPGVVAVQGDGKIVVAGGAFVSAANGYNDFFVARLDTAGRLDPTF